MFQDLEKNISLFIGWDNTKFPILNTEDVPDAYKKVKTGPQQRMIFLLFTSEILF